VHKTKYASVMGNIWSAAGLDQKQRNCFCS